MAIEQAKIAKDKSSLPFGAVVVHEGEIIGRGHDNASISHDVTAHAELDAIRQACEVLGRNNLEDCEIYCTNEPCNMCASGIFQADIKTIVIGLQRTDLPALLRPRNIRIFDLAKDLSYTPKITTSVLKNEILELFSNVKK